MPAWGTQRGWAWCSKCQGLWFAGNPNSRCPAGQEHSQTGSGNYALAHNAGAGQPDWRFCNRCHGLFFGGNPNPKCPLGGAHDKSTSGNYRLPIVEQSVRVHTKVLTSPNVPLTTMFQSMREVYASANIDVQWATDEALNLPGLESVDIGGCTAGSTTTEQNQLFQNRNNVLTRDVVVYFVLQTNPAANGCAAFPAGKPGAVVAQAASQWTMAHEVGHVLGLFHVDDPPATVRLFDRLMTGGGTFNITNPPPDLITTEEVTVDSSTLTHGILSF